MANQRKQDTTNPNPTYPRPERDEDDTKESRS